MDDILAILKKIGEMKKIGKTGFTDSGKAAEYLQEKEMLIEELAKTLETVTSSQTTTIERLEGTIKSLRDELKIRSSTRRN
jgi:hypothetical protein